MRYEQPCISSDSPVKRPDDFNYQDNGNPEIDTIRYHSDAIDPIPDEMPKQAESARD